MRSGELRCHLGVFGGQVSRRMVLMHGVAKAGHRDHGGCGEGCHSLGNRHERR
jgi:hypothetical protein